VEKLWMTRRKLVEVTTRKNIFVVFPQRSDAGRAIAAAFAPRFACFLVRFL
jgi:hypothetical protein